MFKFMSHVDMSEDIQIIATITLRVKNLERSRAFYGDVLGLEPREGRDALTLPLFVGGSEAPIVRLVESPSASPKPQRAVGLYHFALLVPSRPALGAVLHRLADRGIRLQGASDHHVSEALYLSDPDGHGIEIYRDRPRGEWTYTSSGELHMTTEPLDLNALAATSDGAAGLADDTTIGHIHLHVSDLKLAEAFYAEDLGFDVTVRSYPGALFLSTAGYHHHVGLNTWAGANAARPDDDTIGMVEFAVRPPKKLPADRRTVTDPDGIRIQLGDGSPCHSSST